MTLRIDYLNHASVLIHLGPHRVLCDPWFSGEAFANGWGLRYENPEALELAATATHLWISHWHSDHLHVPTLRAIAARNPSMLVLANVSANFSMVERLHGLGFTNITELYERKPLALGGELTVTRYPTAGIDNALHMQSPDFSILNYNDCNLPAAALKALRKNTGPIDLLLNNYNHAGKLFKRASLDAEKDQLWRALLRSVELIQPTWIVPFASSHYYKTKVSRDQNGSLLTFDDLAARSLGDERFLVLRVGDAVEIESRVSTQRMLPRTPMLPMSPEVVTDYGPSVAWEELLRAADERCALLRKGFPMLGRMLGELTVRISDLDRSMTLAAAHGGRSARPDIKPHIECHSRALFEWLGRRFGDDSFMAGAHFAILDPDTQIIERWALATLLEASHLSLRDCFGYLGTRAGRWFLWCRREEIFSTFKSGKLKAAQVRLD